MTASSEHDYVAFDGRPHGAHAKLLDLVPAGSRVLDVGCSAGYLSERLAHKGCEVVGVELDPAAARLAERWCARVVPGDVERMELAFAPGSFDVILCGDLVEHLRDPGRALARLRPVLRAGGRLVLSTPNVANWSIRAGLLFGRFRYTNRGLLDRTHTHLFTRKTLAECVEGAGYVVDSLDVTAPLPRPLRGDRTEAAAHRIAALQPGLFAYQFVLAARTAS